MREVQFQSAIEAGKVKPQLLADIVFGRGDSEGEDSLIAQDRSYGLEEFKSEETTQLGGIGIGQI